MATTKEELQAKGQEILAKIQKAQQEMNQDNAELLRIEGKLQLLEELNSTEEETPEVVE